MIKRSRNNESRKRTRASLTSYQDHNHINFKNTSVANSVVSMTQEELTSDVQWGSVGISTNIKNLGKVERERGFGISNDDITHPTPLFRVRSIPRRFLPRITATDDSNSVNNEDTSASLQKLMENIGNIKSPVDTKITEGTEDSITTNSSALSVSNQVDVLITNKPDARYQSVMPTSSLTDSDVVHPDTEMSHHQKLTQHLEKYPSTIVTPQYRKSIDYNETMSCHSKISTGTHTTNNISDERTTVLQDVMLTATDDFSMSLVVTGGDSPPLDKFPPAYASQVLPYLKYGGGVTENNNSGGMDSQPDLAHSSVLFSTTATTMTDAREGGREVDGVFPWLPVVAVAAEPLIDFRSSTENSINRVSEIENITTTTTTTATTITSTSTACCAISTPSYSFKTPDHNSSSNLIHDHTTSSSHAHMKQTEQQQPQSQSHLHPLPTIKTRAQESPEEVTEEFMLLLEQMEAEARLSSNSSSNNCSSNNSITTATITTSTNQVDVLESKLSTNHSSECTSIGKHPPSDRIENYSTHINKKCTMESESNNKNNNNSFEVCEDISLEELRLLEDMELAAITLFAEKKQLSQQQNQPSLQSFNTVSPNMHQHQPPRNGYAATTTLSGRGRDGGGVLSSHPPQYLDSQKENIKPQSKNILQNQTSIPNSRQMGQSQYQQSCRSLVSDKPDMVDRMVLINPMQTIDLSLSTPHPLFANATTTLPTTTIDTLHHQSSSSLPPTLTPTSPPFTCHRYIALEVVEHQSHNIYGRCKEVRCFSHQPTGNTTITTPSITINTTIATTASNTPLTSRPEELAAPVVPPLPSLLPQHLRVIDSSSNNHNIRSTHRGGRSRPQSQLDGSYHHHHHPIKAQSIWLQGDWMDCEIRGGDVFHIINLNAKDINRNTIHDDDCNPNSRPSQPLSICVNNTFCILVLHPDTMVSPTKIVESCSCTRKAVLSERIRNLGGAGLAAVMGNVKHEFVEGLIDLVLPRLAMIANPEGGNVSAKPFFNPQHHHPSRISPPPPLLSDQEFLCLLQSTLRSHVEELWATGVTEQQLKLELGSLVPPLLTWLTQTRSDNTTSNRPVADESSGRAFPLLKAVAGVEEVLWSPLLGIKGQLDLVVCNQGSGMMSSSDSVAATTSASCLLFPIEIKTGKWRPSITLPHRAQVILYVLMLLVRQRTSSSNDGSPINLATTAVDADVTSIKETIPVGMLLYVSDIIRCEVVTPSWDDMRALMITRNNLAVHLKKTFDLTTHSLPPLLRNRNDCENCYQASECMLTHAAQQQGTAHTSGVSQLFGYLLRGLSASHIEYFKHWQNLLNLEAVAEKTRRGKTVWIENASDLTHLGIKSLGGLSVVSIQQSTSTTGTANTIMSGDTILTLRIAGREVVGGGRNSPLGQPPPSPHYTATSGHTNNNTSSNDKNIISNHYNNNTVFNVGDRVVVSVEYTAANRSDSRASGNYSKTSSLTSSSNHPSSTNININIEDLLTPPPVSLPAVEPCICTGTLLQVTEDCIQLTVTKSLRRLQWLLGSRSSTSNPMTTSSSSSRWTIRLDDDHSYNNIATLRASVYSLFVSPHDPKEYTKSISPSNNNPHTTTTSTPHLNPRISSLSIASSTGGTSASHTNSNITHNYTNTNDQEYPAVTMLANYSHCSSNNSNVTESKFRLRQLIVDLFPPQFDTLPLPLRVDSFDSFMALLAIKPVIISEETNGRNKPGIPTMSITTSQLKLPTYQAARVFAGCDPRQLWREYYAMNTGQQQAVLRVLLAKDYVLLLGMPGTGKSSTLAFVIRCLIARGDKVLLTAYTHAAIDHVLLKLQESGVTEEIAARIGSPASIVPTFHRYLLKPADGSQVMQSFVQRIANTRLVLCTALTASRNIVVNQLQFEWCVVDEAGQISQPAALGPVMAARKFILVGDHYQLPPLVVSVEAQSKGMDVSLFKRLAEAHPDAVTSLTVQYRMNSDIMALCNRLIYNYRLRCGDSKIASSRLQLPNFSVVSTALRSSSRNPIKKAQVMTNDQSQANASIDWLLRCIDPQISVVFFNTDEIMMQSLSVEAATSNITSNDKSILIMDTTNNNSNRNSNESLSTISSLSNSSKSSDSLQDSNSSGTTTTSTSNAFETELVRLMVEVLVQCNCFPSHSLGLLSPFRHQVAMLQTAINPLTSSLSSPFSSTSMPTTTTTTTSIPGHSPPTSATTTASIQIATVDKFQGKDVDILIISTVKSIRDKSPGDLLSDWRRINVALTRARSKLIILGSVKTLSILPVFADMIQMMKDRDWLITPTWTDVSLAAFAVDAQKSNR